MNRSIAKEQICKICKIIKPTSQFYKDYSKKNGCKTICKKCFPLSRISSMTPKQLIGILDTEKEPLKSEDFYQEYPEFIPKDKFDPNKFYTVVLSASRRSGKTNLVIHFLKQIYPILQGLYH